jgi:hypothetical protein
MFVLVLTPLNIYAFSQQITIESDYESTFTNENIKYNQELEPFIDDPPYLPFPGDLIDDAPIFQTFEIPKRESHHHEIYTKFDNNLIIDILNQLNETMYLEYLEDLVDFGPRVTGSSECEEAGEYIYSQFESMGLQVRYHDWTYGSYSGSNIEGTLEGINDTSDEIYIICAHYDSVPGSPGADDDGSGTAAVLAAAELLSKYEANHTVRFVAFSGEEQGLLGSSRYVQEASENGDNIVAALNGDMIGFALSTNDGNNIKVYENSESHWITEFTNEVSISYDEYIGLNLVPSGFSSGSDHYPFWQNGYNAVFYHEWNFNDFYHSPQDIIENMNISYAVKSSKLMVATLALLAQSLIPSEPPNQPTITGPATGMEEKEYGYTFVTTDPEGEKLYYFIEWGDGTNSTWIGPWASGETGEAFHAWSEPGDYNIRVKARDIYKKESDWSTPISIHILEPAFVNIGRISGGLFRVNAVITNNGEIDANNVNWSISLEGGAFIGKETSGTIDIPAMEKVTVNSKLILGFGPVEVKIKASIPESSDAVQIGGYILFFFVNVHPGGAI